MKDETLLLRQVHPSFVQDGRVTSQAFRPTPKDQNRLSVYDGDQIDASGAWHHYTESLGHRSVGVMAVTVSECAAEALKVKPDPEPFPEHAVAVEKKAKKLRIKAAERDWLYHFGQ